MKLGSQYQGDNKTKFTVWAPTRDRVAVRIVEPEERLIELNKNEWGYWEGQGEDVAPGTLYFYQLDGEIDRPDPASHHQPKGVHGPSEVIDQQSYGWQDGDWQGIPQAEMIIYELHVGTFTPEGTFVAIIDKLPYLKDLGVNAIEIMPVAQFPGDRNWGYDGVYIYGVQNSYGGPAGLKKLVDACHREGIAVILDVVYNHLGPEGNYLWDYGRGIYFMDKYKTPWGSALNFDDAYCNEVRNYFIENTLYWLENYHIDGLRLDAIHAIYDMSARPFLQELAARVGELKGRTRYLIAESDLNDMRILRSPEKGGFGLHGQWCDEFHHTLHTLITGENDGYYSEFGTMKLLEKAYKQGYVYDGIYSPHRKRNHGNSPKDFGSERFVVCIQNHDQVGNRLGGDRLSTLVDFEALKLAAGAMLLSAFVPMLFMGEEYGEEAPFMYFISHGDPGLIDAVRKGRAEEFKAFGWDKVPDPQGKEVFMQSKLNWDNIDRGKHGALRSLYKKLIQLRQNTPALAKLYKNNLEVHSQEEEKILWVYRHAPESKVFYVMNFNGEASSCSLSIPQGNWSKILDTSDQQWMGPGSEMPDRLSPGETLKLNPWSLTLYEG